MHPLDASPAAPLTTIRPEGGEVMAKQYPDCGPLRSDAAELTAFALTLKLIDKLKAQGHTPRCAMLMVGADKPCICKPETP